MDKRRIKREISAGGVVFKRYNNKIKILLLKTNRNKWVLPKGKIEEGERLEKTALREVCEETGLKSLKIKDKLGKENYYYRAMWLNNQLIFKTVFYFLIENLKEEKINPQKEEGFIDGDWFNFRKAYEISAFKQTKKILNYAKERINK